jgi:orotidine-5'-phosphate decarboxylase
MDTIIPLERSIIPACDVPLDRFEVLLQNTCDIAKIGGYKIGAALAVTAGLPRIVEIARKHTNKPLIYDHQKACTDIPDTATGFMRAVKASGIDALILFPLSGPATQTAWIQSAQDEELSVIVGGHMTHERYLTGDGGYIDDHAVDKMFTNAAHLGVTDYVVPGNKPDAIRHLRELLLEHKIEPVFYAPGFIAQSGSISEAAQVAGSRWHAIVGRAIYEAQDMHKAALSLAYHL